jgi:glycosyltransferase involved in cell wall biosynthesis
MRVLYLSPFKPLPMTSGAALRVAGMLQSLTRFADVKFLCLGPALDLTPPEGLPNLVGDFEMLPMPPRPAPRQGFDWGEQWKGIWQYPSKPFYRFISPENSRILEKRIRAFEPDVLLLESEFVAWPLLRWQAWLRTSAMALVVSFLDVLSVISARQAQALPRWGLYKLRQWVDAQKLRFFERRLLAIVDASLAMSKADQQQLWALHAGANVKVVPNGFDVPPALPPDRPKAPIVLLVGTFRYAPNETAFCFFAEQVWPLIHAQCPSAEFWAAGRGASNRMVTLAMTHPQIRLVGADGDVGPFYGQAAVVVVPVLVGGGTRFKILEAFARGVPVVSTTVGYEGIEATLGLDLLVADTPIQMAHAVIELLQSPVKRRQLAENGYRRVQPYDWKVIGQTLQNTLEEVVIARRRGGH